MNRRGFLGALLALPVAAKALVAKRVAPHIRLKVPAGFHLKKYGTHKADQILIEKIMEMRYPGISEKDEIPTRVFTTPGRKP